MSARPLQFDRLAILGVGLLGGSVALAARERRLAGRIVGVGRNPRRLDDARRRGVIDEALDDPAKLGEVDLVVVCTPVDRLAGDIRAALDGGGERCLVTDVGSVKAAVIHNVQRHGAMERYVPAHPLAGSHQTGYEHARADLFDRRVCVLTPVAETSRPACERIAGFWRALGMDVREMSPEEHDRILGLTSHLPHLAAAAVANVIDEELLEYASSGYRDTTRVAAGDPELWSAIFSLNAVPLAAATDRLLETLQQFRALLMHDQRPELELLLRNAQQLRRAFPDPGNPEVS